MSAEGEKVSVFQSSRLTFRSRKEKGNLFALDAPSRPNGGTRLERRFELVPFRRSIVTAVGRPRWEKRADKQAEEAKQAQLTHEGK